MALLRIPMSAGVIPASLSLSASSKSLAVCQVRLAPVFVAEASSVETAPDAAAPASLDALPRQSDDDRKAQLKAEQRRKRLVEKRHLRKKGRWPPSKMKKQQNV